MKIIKSLAIITLLTLATASSAFAYNGTSIYNTGYSHAFQEAFEAQ